MSPAQHCAIRPLPTPFPLHPYDRVWPRYLPIEDYVHGAAVSKGLQLGGVPHAMTGGVLLGGSEKGRGQLDVSGVVHGDGLMHNAASWGRVFRKGMEINTKHCGLLTQTRKSCEQ